MAASSECVAILRDARAAVAAHAPQDEGRVWMHPALPLRPLARAGPRSLTRGGLAHRRALGARGLLGGGGALRPCAAMRGALGLARQRGTRDGAARLALERVLR